MSLDRKNGANREAHTKVSWRMHLLITMMGILALGIVCYGFYLGHRMNRVYSPLVYATLEIRIEATQAYLWYEEIIGGDESTDIALVWNHMDQAEWYANAMLQGGKNADGVYVALDDQDMRSEIKMVKGDLAELRSILNQRLGSIQETGPGSPFDRLYHDKFKQFIDRAKGIETRLKKIMANDMRVFKAIQTVLIFLCVGLFAGTLIVFTAFERRRVKAFLIIEKTRSDLEEQAVIQAQVESKLRESERKFRLIAESAQDVFWISTPGMKEITYLSPAFEKIWGHNPDRFYQSPGLFIETICPEDRNLVLAKQRNHEQGTWDIEYRIVRPDDSVRWVQDRGVPVKDKNGKLVQMTGVARDVTKLKLLEGKLIQSEKLAAIGLMVSSVAHEINNPNNFIIFNLPILKEYLQSVIPIVDEYANNQVQFELFDMSYTDFRQDIFNLIDNIEHGSSRINRIVLDLKDYVKKKDGVKKDWVNLKPIIEKAVSICRGKINRIISSFEMDVPDGLPKAYTDPDIIDLILINILNNAVETVDRDDSWLRIDVAIRENLDDQIIINVSDNYCGIDDRSMGLVFDPFYTPKSPNEGTGLGLYLSHVLADQIGAEIEIKSTPGQGSTVSLLITNPEN